MREVILRPDAEADIEDAADYTIQQWGAEQARAYVRELRRATEQLATTALRHSIHNTIYPGLRRKRSGMHHIYYLATENCVEVLNIIHVSRDPAQHLKMGEWRDD